MTIETTIETCPDCQSIDFHYIHGNSMREGDDGEIIAIICRGCGEELKGE